MDLSALGFDTVETLRAEGSTEVYRCIQRADGKPVVVKAISPSVRTPLTEARLRYEFNIARTASAARVTGIMQPLQLVVTDSVFALVSHDTGGYALSYFGHNHKWLDMREILRVAIGAAEALTQIHRAGVVHKDINAQNIVFNRDTGAVEIIDFGISAQVPRERPNLDPSGKPQGTLSYMSPEQTGRTSHLLDYRTDFYSLGVTLYYLLTKHLPFIQTNLHELMHAILAQSPAPPHILNRQTPAPLSALVLKLMAKNADDRYQSSHGIVADLTRILEMVTQDSVESFDLGAADYSERLQVQDKLYGREADIERLLSAYHRCITKRSEMVLVRGPPGIGKSALVHELRAPILAQQGYFAEGKCDELHRHVPLAVFRQVIADVLQQVLKESEPTVRLYRSVVLGAVGQIGQVLVEIIPEVEWLIGRQPPVPSLGTRENQNRLQYAMQKLLFALTSQRPLVLFLDDVQWADSSTLMLLDALNADATKLRQSLLVCALRDTEVNASHALNNVLQNARRKNPQLVDIAVRPLAVKHIEFILADSLRRKDAAARTLAELVHAKTGGNPFFVAQFLKHLWTHAFLTLDPARGTWDWDIARIRAADVTENVVALMMRQINDLDADSRTMLSLAACLGGHFELRMLSMVAERTPEMTLDALWPALQAGLLVSLDADYRYRHGITNAQLKFSHDRIQQAAYELQSPTEQERQHFVIAMALLRHRDTAKMDQWIFEVIDHVNRGAALMPPSEKGRIFTLNLAAGLGAKRSAAYRSAIQFFQMAIEQLPADAWDSDYARTQSVYFELVSCACFAGMVEFGQRTLEDVLPRLHTPEEKARVYAMRAQALHIVGTGQNVIDTCREGLALLGVRIPKKTGPLQVAWLLARAKLALVRRSTADLEGMPEIRDERTLVCMDLLMQLTVGAYMTENFLFAASALRLLLVTLERGNSRYSAVSYSLFAMMAVSGLRDDKTARAMMELALRRLQVRPDSACPSFVLGAKAGFFLHRDETDAQRILEFGIDADRMAEETGDPSLMVASTLALSLNLVAHADLPVTDERYGASFAFSYGERSLQSQLGASGRQAARALMGRTDAPTSLSDRDFDEAATLTRLEQGNPIPWSVHWLWRALVCFFAGDDEQAWKALDTSMRSPVFSTMFGSPAPVEAAVIGSLMIFRFAKARGRMLLSERWRLRKFLGYITWNAENGANNYGGLLPLYRAEEAALRGDDSTAMYNFEQAAAKADRGVYRSYAGLCHEQAARFYRDRGLHELAARHVQRAISNYSVWGVAPKVKAMQAEFSEYWRSLKSAGGFDPNITMDFGTVTVNTASPYENWDVALQAAQALSGEIHQERLVHHLLTRAITHAGAQRGVLLLMQNGQLNVVADEGQAHEGRDSYPERVMQYVARSKQRVVLGDAQSSEYANDPYIADARVRSLLCSPLLHQGKLMGVVYLENNVTTDAFLTGQVRIVDLLASQAAISLENAQLYTNLENVVGERTRELRSAQELLMKLERDNAEVQMAGGFAHEMRNALSGAKNLLALSMGAGTPDNLPAWEQVANAVESIHDLVSPMLDDAQDAQLRHHVGRVIEELERFSDSVHGTERSIERALKITRQILDYARLGRVVPEYETVQVWQVIETLVHNMDPDFTARRIAVNVVVPRDLVVVIKETHLQSVVENLLANARDALGAVTDDTQLRSIRIEALREPTRVVIKVTDTGPGIPDTIRPRLFDPFFSTKPTSGTGLGLGVVRKLLELYQGRVSFTSQVGEGTCFEVELPLESPSLGVPVVDERSVASDILGLLRSGGTFAKRLAPSLPAHSRSD